MNIDEQQLEGFIIDSGLVSREELLELKKTAEEKKLGLSEVVVQKGVLSHDDARRIRAYTLGVPFVNLKSREFDLATLSMIPEPVSRNHNIVAYHQTEESLEVALLDLADLSSVDFIREKIGLKIVPRLTDSESLKWALLSYQKALKLSFGELIQRELENPNLVVDTLFQHALLQSASHIHIEPEGELVLVRYRLGGVLREAMVLPQNSFLGIVTRLKTLAGLKMTETSLPQEGRFRLEAKGEQVSVRLSFLPVYSGEKVVMRLVREKTTGFTLESLGLHGESLDEVYEVLTSKSGLILVVGEKGSGKTTTLYTLLDLVNEPSASIVTIEDPIECRVPRVSQLAVRPELGLTFSVGLRTLLRQDPDVVMVSEIRDSEVARLTTEASLRGCLVLSALEAPSSAKAISRLLEMGVDPLLASSTLKLVVAGRLVRRLAENREKYFLSREEIGDLEKQVSLPRVLELLKQERVVSPEATWDKIPFYKAVPGVASESGYVGRVGLFEILKLTPAVKELIAQGASTQRIEEEARALGFITLAEDGLFKAVQGLTSLEEVVRTTSLRL